MSALFEPAFETHPGWRRIYPDLPGHGRTLVPPSLRNHDDLIDLILEFMDAIALGERFVIAGQSWGGYLAQAIVQRRLKQIDGVMLYVPAITRAVEHPDLPTRQVIYQDPAFAAALRPGEEWFQEDVFVVQSLPALEYLHTVLDAYGAPQDPKIVELMDTTTFSFDPNVLPEPCPAPALLLTGRQDNAVGYKDAWKVLENYPRGTFAVLDRAGHALPFEQRALAFALLNEWLNRVEEYIEQNLNA